jgi:hypothetical protein
VARPLTPDYHCEHLHEEAGDPRVTAFIASVLAAVAMTGVVYVYGRRRPPGTPLTWGEAFVAALFVFGFMLLIYGVVPNQWILYANNILQWRSDKVGIPAGPLHNLPGWPTQGKVLFFIPTSHNALWPQGITFFGHGRIRVTKAHVSDVVATLIYVVGIGGQVSLWSWWQKRGAKKPEIPELTSAYGRPLVRKA